jgi:hypothetical protein
MQTLPANNGADSVLLGFIGGLGERVLPGRALLNMAKQIQAPTFKKWRRLTIASRHGCCLHILMPICGL